LTLRRPSDCWTAKRSKPATLRTSGCAWRCAMPLNRGDGNEQNPAARSHAGGPRRPFCRRSYFAGAADRWRELKRHIPPMYDGLDMARIEVCSRPLTEGQARMIERHLKFGLGENSA